jgi:hypothetical protein
VEPAPKPADDWQQKFKSLDGVIRSRDAKILQISQELEQTKLELQRLSSAPSRQPEPVASNPQDVEMFGADLVEMVKRMSQQTLADVSDSYGERFKQLEQRMEGTAGAVAQSEQDKFFARIEASVPDWDAVNEDDAFRAWLGEADPVYGVPRQSALKVAQDNLDAGQVIRIFQAFKGLAAPVIAPKVNPLDKQVAPRAVASAPAQVPTQTTISQGAITAFYRDVAQGKYRGNEARQQQMESEINAAMAEGRIT